MVSGSPVSVSVFHLPHSSHPSSPSSPSSPELPPSPNGHLTIINVINYVGASTTGTRPALSCALPAAACCCIAASCQHDVTSCWWLELVPHRPRMPTDLITSTPPLSPQTVYPFCSSILTPLEIVGQFDHSYSRTSRPNSSNRPDLDQIPSATLTLALPRRSQDAEHSRDRSHSHRQAYVRPLTYPHHLGSPPFTLTTIVTSSPIRSL